MHRSNFNMRILAILAWSFLSVAVEAAVSDFHAAYCSSQNTAPDSGPYWDQYQSNGACTTTCRGKRTAFAVILGQDCYCSDYVPYEQTDTGECHSDCPGYPSEKCGNTDKNLYIYLALGPRPSGTQGAPQPTSAPPPKSSEAPSSTPAPTPTTFQTTTSSESEPQVPIQTIKTIIISGGSQVVTQIITPSSSSIPDSEQNPNQDQKKESNVGAIVGGVVGGIAAIAAIIGAAFFTLWRRRRRQQDDSEESQSGVQRNTSTMSKAGLLRTEKAPQHPPRIATNFTRSTHNSRILGDDMSISPISASDKRSSRPYIFDQRLNPSAIMNFENTSRGSFVSMDDSRDYGRTLNVRNPDPDPHQG